MTANLIGLLQALNPEPVMDISADYTTKAGDVNLRVDTTGGAVTITIASASHWRGKRFKIKDAAKNILNNPIHIVTEGTELIDGAATYDMDGTTGVNGMYIELLSNGIDLDVD